ncbi:DMT family transporter [Bordetella pseudohinzii]|uniref:Multidrug DMT transporter permease n=1 Tax=Bordetella pseudohinzii TaxID=1331258 RepID=A0A0J6C180_9BORD|nr:DMT family transporter [Bordetella pseudohinzii]ANY16073.1 multidrug DMT transporter permease [Bordetella pseudohinzii]KMM24531.1 multidrug DMT transporter permease [Bordetella pseudohinzii]KXA78549.1 multidrug DMT transporter permease [Bordetella pseudohinzii]KXA78617.1 multidrug DMT transporter permease [Bordetella pseudohinzii]CUJ11166.1 putative chloramphenical resistance permease RarD [Bordetella pseudohinzii]
MHTLGATPATETAGLWQMAAAMTLSGTIGLFVLESGQSAWNVVFFRCLFGMLGLAAYAQHRGMLRHLRLSRRDWALALLSGAALVMNWVLLFSAYRLASISLATAVYHVQPFLLIGLGVLVLHEKLSRARLAWTALAFGGLLCILQWRHGPAPGGYLLGLSLGLGAAACYTLTALIVKQLKHVPPQVLALVQVSLGVVMLLPLADFSALPAAPAQWACLLALGLVHTSLMYILMYSAIQRLPTTSVAAMSFIYPAVAILLDLAVYGQRLGASQWLGVGLIFLAAAGVSLAGRR